ncbi:glycosyltransferase family 9 protein [Allomuricauda sp. d1]|uniref:glycosyltransferase family 9 protein n=1 Tax=Allomuricauda sp. d1 TaxID=3136725 RepID=UPI0031D1EA93
MAKKAEYGHLLVIRFSALGDVAMTVPVLLAVTKKYPQLRITVVSRGFHNPLFKGIDNIDFYEARLDGDHKGVFGLWKLYKSLKSLHIDAVADLHNVLRSAILKSFFNLSGFKVVQIDKGRAEKKALTSNKGKVFKQLKSTHQRYAEVFSKLGYPVELTHDDVLERLPLSDKILSITGNNTLKWIGIAPFAAHSGKMYPIKKMENIVADLLKTERYKMFFFGGGATEKEQLDALASNHDTIVNITGRLSFSEELELISNLDLMVSMDSANGHLAANYGVPAITLWGVTHPYAGFYPYGQPMDNALLSDKEKYPLIPTSIYGNKVPKGYENVMETISEHEILSKIKQVLEHKNQ